MSESYGSLQDLADALVATYPEYDVATVLVVADGGVVTIPV